jgi:hypothetical protein
MGIIIEQPLQLVESTPTVAQHVVDNSSNEEVSVSTVEIYNRVCDEEKAEGGYRGSSLMIDEAAF